MPMCILSHKRGNSATHHTTYIRGIGLLNRKEKPLRELNIINWRVFKRLERRDLDEEAVCMPHVFSDRKKGLEGGRLF